METVREQLAEPLLSAAEERALARQIEAGVLAGELRVSGRPFLDASDAELRILEQLGEQARQRFIRANLRLVGLVARQAAFRSQLPENDLFQEGCVGLIVAVHRFDWQRGCKFSTYALFWIRAHIGAATARSLGAMNLPTTRAAQLRAVRGVETRLSQQLGRPASVTELASLLGRPEQWTATLIATEAPRLVELADADADGLLHDGGQSIEEVLDHDRPGTELLRRIDGVDRQVLELRLGFVGDGPHSYAEIARALGISVNRVRRAERRALDRLRAICPQSAVVHL